MKTRKGFTLIELMIVIAIIAIIAAIAIPNLMRSRIQANEANAVAALKAYTTAQVTFQTGKQGRLETNTKQGATGYADNYRNLFFGNPVAQTAGVDADGKAIGVQGDVGRNLALINQTFADAHAAGPLADAATTNTVPITPVTAATGNPYQGYFFAEPTSLTAPDFKYNFALFAVPGNSSTNGNNAFWVGQEGTVWMQGLAPDAPVTDSVTSITKATPSDSTSRANWITM